MYFSPWGIINKLQRQLRGQIVDRRLPTPFQLKYRKMNPLENVVIIEKKQDTPEILRTGELLHFRCFELQTGAMVVIQVKKYPNALHT